jgi:bifunctional NMN adenylyltransferase/nudix hydrolase
MNKTRKTAILIGRFQPFHKGHEEAIRLALQQVDHVILVCGSSYMPRTPRNPWTFAERETMVRTSLPDHNQQITLIPIMDTPYNEEAWISRVQKGVAQTFENTELQLIDKDYSQLFPAWDHLELALSKNISGSEIRNKYLQATQNSNELSAFVPSAVASFLDQFSTTPEFAALLEEKAYIDNYKKSWETAPYPPTFVTVDALVRQGDHILMIKRRDCPGKNLWGLPGGFVNQDETLFDACLRELKEETCLEIPESALKSSFKAKNLFDYPYRSLRGRTITNAFYFELSNEKALPHVEGADDAKQALWFSISQLDSTQMFEDHFSIIQHFLRIDMN